MKNIAADILINASPAVLLALGALTTECAGAMAIFLEGMVCMGAFFCIAFSIFAQSLLLGALASLLLCTALVATAALFMQKTRANAFLVGAAVNLFASGLIPVLSQLWFGTSGVVASPAIAAGSFWVRGGTSIAAWLAAVFLAFVLYKTVWGLNVRVCGSAPDVLAVNGTKPEEVQMQTWCVAALCAAAAGCILCIRVQSYVPNISSARGWSALAAVFLGKRKVLPTMAAALFFAAAEYAANVLQGTFAFAPSLLLALPYCAALALFLLMPCGN